MPTHPGIDVDQNTDLIYFFIDINAGANNPLDFLCAKNTLQVSEVGLWWIRSDSDCLLQYASSGRGHRRWSEAGEVCLHANALQVHYRAGHLRASRLIAFTAWIRESSCPHTVVDAYVYVFKCQ